MRWFGDYTPSGKKLYKFIGRIDPRDVSPEDFVIQVPCGKCLGCRLDYSRSWADRMMLELETSKKAIFVTLTYDNDHVPICKSDELGAPVGFTLCKKDCQDFMKRLRERFVGVKCRFYLSGEYGPITQRPHYHAIIFGIGLEDVKDLNKHGTNELGDTYYISEWFNDIWQNGFVVIAPVSWKTCAYVSRYVMKKVNNQNVLLNDFFEREPEFALMSRRPGLGSCYYDLHPDCLDYANINLTTPDGGLKLQIPKYYLTKLSLTDPEKYAKLIEERKDYACDNMILKLQKTTLSYIDFLEVQEEAKRNKIKALRRGKVAL